MCVVGHGYGELGGVRNGGGGYYACGTKTEGCVACREIKKHSQVLSVDTDDTQSHRLPGTRLWVGSSRNWSVFLGRPYSLSMLLAGYTPWCSTDAVVDAYALPAMILYI